MDDRFKELMIEKENLIENIKFYKSEHNDVMVKNDFLTLELDHVRKTQEVKMKSFIYPSSKILSEGIKNGKPHRDKEAWST